MRPFVSIAAVATAIVFAFRGHTVEVPLWLILARLWMLEEA